MFRRTSIHFARKSRAPTFGKKKSKSSKAWLKRQSLDPYSIQNSQPKLSSSSFPHHKRSTSSLLSTPLPSSVIGGGLSSSSSSPPRIISRAQHKLSSILPPRKYSNVLDLGCRPCSWSYLISQTYLLRSGKITGIDILPTSVPSELPPSIFTFIKANALTHTYTSTYDLIISDVSPNRTGIKTIDSIKQNTLTLSLINKSETYLRGGGDVVFKYSRGEGKEDIENWGRGKFDSWKVKKPEASRGESREGYVLGRGWKGG
ncbi:hypothetical protein TrVE_jg2523 [Triparma verrucosa]|uniref:rRNA methyltransferase 2, mitochondrial n=1 Tax=Triparma verrucosa TaxID=1606542 RepID=A0A9W7C5V8_9STRA|nr:hypothetical protein TrVE_jg2523 [Triparma verrucosa]